MITGECFCGEIGYQIDGPLLDARSCHCSRCRKAFSGAGSAYALVETGSFSWLRGEERLTTYASQQGAGLQFCNQCGTTLCGLFEGVVHGVTLGSLNGDPEVSLARHIFVESKASWDSIGGDAPQFAGFPE